MNTSPTDSTTMALRAICWCVCIAGVAASAIYLTVAAWLILTMLGV
jgi:hypothetical protein